MEGRDQRKETERGFFGVEEKGNARSVGQSVGRSVPAETAGLGKHRRHVGVDPLLRSLRRSLDVGGANRTGYTTCKQSEYDTGYIKRENDTEVL